MTSFAWLIASSAFIRNLPVTARRYAPSLSYTTARLDRELHALTGDDDLQAGRALISLLLRFDRDAIQRVVASVRVVVIEHKALHLRFRGHVDRARDGGVTPRRLEVALEELRIVDQRVRAGGQRDHRIWSSGEGIL